MTIDGFLQFLGLVVAVYALFGVVNRYRLRLLGWWLWIPTLIALVVSVYLLLFDIVGIECGAQWCSIFEFRPNDPISPNKVAFLVVLTWLIYVASLSRWRSIGTHHLPLLAALVDRLVAEKRFSELVDFIEPHVEVIALCAQRRYGLQKLRDAIRRKDNPFARIAGPAKPDSGPIQRFKDAVMAWSLMALKPIEARLPKSSTRQEAALRILRMLYTNQPVMEFIALERSLFALRLMRLGGNDYDFGDRAFDMMMAHPQSQLRREILLNANVGLCFYVIDPKNPLIHELMSDATVAEKLEVYRPVGNYPIRLLERNAEYRQEISASKPRDDHTVDGDPTFSMIRFFDIMVRSAMRDGIEWHMWLFYYDILVGKLIASMDHGHPDYDVHAEFPNFGYYLIYEVFSAYGDWLQCIDCCPENSPVVKIDSAAPVHENGSILKSSILSIGNSLKHLLKSDADNSMITYILGMLMRSYRDIGVRPNGGARAQQALLNSILNGGYYDLDLIHVARLRDCYLEIDPLLRYETKDFEKALEARLD